MKYKAINERVPIKVHQSNLLRYIETLLDQ